MLDAASDFRRRPWPRPIVLGAVAAVAGAILAQTCGVPGLLLAGGPLLVAALRRSGLDACCLAWPAALAAYVPPVGPLPPPGAGPVLVAGQVVSRLRIDDLHGSTRCVVEHGRARVLCVFARDTRLHPGDRVRALGRLTPRIGRDATFGVVDVPPGGILEVTPARSLIGAAEALRLSLHDGLVRSVPGRAGRLLAQLVLGHGGDIDTDIADAHRATGLSHLLAVSGAHVSLLAAMLSVLVHRSRRQARPTWSVLAAVCVYGAITGFDPPVVRAVLAFALVLVARRTGRRLPTLAALAAPGILTAVLQPQDANTASFALSYAAVAGLTLAPPPRRPATKARVFLYALRASAWATLATAPFTLHLFGQVAPWTIVATPILGPLVAALLALGLVVAVLGALGAASPWLSLPLHFLAEAYVHAVDSLARLPGAPVFAVCTPPLLLHVCCGLIGIVLLVARPRRSGVACLCLALTSAHFVPWPPGGVGTLRLFDVGHGQACLLQLADGSNVVIDCGSQGNPRGAADALARGLAPRRRIDLLVLTHRDADHTAGVPSLLRRAHVRNAALPVEMADGLVAQALRRSGARVLAVAAGAQLEPIAGVRVLRPGQVESTLSNDHGLWVSAAVGSVRVLCPGDAEEAGVRAFLESGHPAGADVLIVPHHGRPHRALGPLLAAVAPRLALVSGGRPDVRCPAAAASARRGIRLIETAHVGEIVIEATAPPRLRVERPEPLLPAAK